MSPEFCPQTSLGVWGPQVKPPIFSWLLCFQPVISKRGSPEDCKGGFTDQAWGWQWKQTSLLPTLRGTQSHGCTWLQGRLGHAPQPRAWEENGNGLVRDHIVSATSDFMIQARQWKKVLKWCLLCSSGEETYFCKQQASFLDTLMLRKMISYEWTVF